KPVLVGDADKREARGFVDCGNGDAWQNAARVVLYCAAQRGVLRVHRQGQREQRDGQPDQSPEFHYSLLLENHVTLNARSVMRCSGRPERKNIERIHYRRYQVKIPSIPAEKCDQLYTRMSICGPGQPERII